MSDTAPTGELKFGPQPTGLFVAHDDLKLYLSALHAMRTGRHDTICAATVAQLMDLMTQAFDDETGGSVEICRRFDDCRITTATLDTLVHT